MKQPSATNPSREQPGGRWWRLAAGLLLLTAFITLLATAPLPGAVLQHNTEQDIQATALFYMDLERMQDIEQTLETIKEADSDAAP